MKAFFATLFIAATPALVLAQTPAAPAKPEAKPAAKETAKPKAKLARSAQKAVEVNTPIEDDPSI